MLSIFAPLLQVGSIFGDLELVLKVVGLLFIISFVRSHIQHPILSVGIIVLMSGFLLFDFWKVFGGALFLYLLAIFGFLHILVDLSFLHAFKEPIINVGGMLSRRSSAPPPSHDPRARYGQQHEEDGESDYTQRQRRRSEYEEDEEHIGGHHPQQHLLNARAIQMQRMRQLEMARRGRKDEN